MGWKASPASVKREAMRGHSVVYPGGRDNPRMKEYKHVVVDVNAWFRSFSLDTEEGISPRFAINTFFWGSLMRTLEADSVTFCFDDYDKASEMRIQFYAKEREKRADRPPKAGEYLCPVTDRLFKYEDRPLEKERIPEITATTMPCRWSRAWNCKDAKIRVWEILAECIKDLVRSGKKTNPDTQYIIHDIHGEIWTYPEGVPGLEATMPIPIEYGEGDLKSILWSLHHSRHGEPTLLATIDWDIPLSMMLHTAPVDVLISRLYVHKEDGRLSEFTFDYNEVAMTHTKAKTVFGSSAMLNAFEIVAIPKLVTTISSYDRRMMYQMACLGFKGVDYCDGINRFGFTLSVYTDMYEKSLVVPRWIESYFRASQPLRRCIRFYPGRYLDFLRYGTPRKADRGAEALEDFTKEVLNMLYVVTYSALFDCVRKPGGPPPPAYVDLFAAASTLDEALTDSTLEYEPLEIEETYPVSKLAYPAAFSYPPKQAEAIEAKYGAAIYEVPADM